MAHFAEINEDNVVIRTIVINNDDADTEEAGKDFIANTLNLSGTWLKTSYNTVGGVHTLGGTPYRKNYGGVGTIYDPVNDAFIAVKPHESWILNPTTYLWEAPIPYPTDGKRYVWSEPENSWLELVE